MESHITATEAVRSFSELLNRMRYRGESFIIERGGVPIGRLSAIGPVRVTLREFAELLRRAPKPDEAFGEAVRSAADAQPRLLESRWDP